jgi:hypothetical protein
MSPKGLAARRTDVDAKRLLEEYADERRYC